MQQRSISGRIDASGKTRKAEPQGNVSDVAHYLFNALPGDAADGMSLRRWATECLNRRMWGIGAGEQHATALAPGDVALIYLGAPERLLIGRATLASAVRAWTPSEAQAYPGSSPGGVLLTSVEQWHPAVPMERVLRRIDRSEGARADFEEGVVGITANEYETALAVMAEA